MLDLRFRPPLSLTHLEQSVDRGLFYYATLRPYQGLGGATPTEIYYRMTPAMTSATSPPRASSRDPARPLVLPFQVTYLGSERRLPFLIPTQIAA